MTIKTFKNIDIEIILEAFNTSFSDYFIPFHLNLEQLKSKMKADKIHLDYSVGVFENKELIGFVLHGFDIVNNKRVIYNGGTGVIPQKRGQGLTKQMYDFILPKLRECKIDYLLLEVISNNIQAIKSYEKSGYTMERELKCFRGELYPIDIVNDIEIKEIKEYNWGLMQSFWDIFPTWQNSKNIVDELIDVNQLIGAYINNQLGGYLIYNPESKRIQQIAVDKVFRRKKVASLLVAYVVKKGRNLSIINVDKRSKITDLFLLKIGFENNINQIEMKLELNKNYKV